MTLVLLGVALIACLFLYGTHEHSAWASVWAVTALAAIMVVMVRTVGLL